MKKLPNLLFALCLAIVSLNISSCKKDPEKAAFSITGLSDQTFNGSDINQSLTIGYTAGPKEAVTLAVSGLPAGITASFSSTSGTPEFSSVLTLKAAGAVTAGTFTVTVTGTSTSGTSSSAAFNLTVPDDCANRLTGLYDFTVTTSGTVESSGVYELSKAPSPANALWLNSPSDPFTPDLITLDCVKMTCRIIGSGDPINGTFTYSPKKTITFDDGAGYLLKLTAK